MNEEKKRGSEEIKTEAARALPGDREAPRPRAEPGPRKRRGPAQQERSGRRYQPRM